jgi:hypothetical protein
MPVEAVMQTHCRKQMYTVILASCVFVAFLNLPRRCCLLRSVANLDEDS